MMTLIIPSAGGRAVVETAEGERIELTGRVLWALLRLIEAGPRGVTAYETPGPRWSAYVHRLRREGFAVETELEPHGGAFPGHHARYRLHTPVRIGGAA